MPLSKRIYTEKDKERKRKYYLAHKMEINERTNKYWAKHKDIINSKRRKK